MRFSIRDVIWLTVVAALALSWLIDRSRLLIQFNEELHAKDVFLHSELERVERQGNEIWMEELRRQMESSRERNSN